MSLFQNIDIKNLHHAYLVEGDREVLLPEIFKFIESLGVSISNNPDFAHLVIDVLKVEDARKLKAFSSEKGASGSKRVFLVSVNNFLLEAQNALLKMFEEPIENTHFFLVVPDRNILLKTFMSRFYVISTRQDIIEKGDEVEKFIKMPLSSRIEFIKDLLKETDEEGDEDIITQNSARARALNFLNNLEYVLHQKTFVKNSSSLLHPLGGTFSDQNSLQKFFEHIFNVRKYLRMPGSSAKNLLESVALIAPNF